MTDAARVSKELSLNASLVIPPLSILASSLRHHFHNVKRSAGTTTTLETHPLPSDIYRGQIL